MKDTITEHQFVDEMSKKQHGFSYDGAKALFEHLTQYEEDCDHELDFDPIAFRCDFDEYENLKKVQESYQDIKRFSSKEEMIGFVIGYNFSINNTERKK